MQRLLDGSDRIHVTAGQARLKCRSFLPRLAQLFVGRTRLCAYAHTIYSCMCMYIYINIHIYIYIYICVSVFSARPWHLLKAVTVAIKGKMDTCIRIHAFALKWIPLNVCNASLYFGRACVCVCVRVRFIKASHGCFAWTLLHENCSLRKLRFMQGCKKL